MRVDEHCAHLGITRGEMALARSREDLTDLMAFVVLYTHGPALMLLVP